MSVNYTQGREWMTSKKWVLAILVAILLPNLMYGQIDRPQIRLTSAISTAPTGGINITGMGINLHRIQWSVTGTVSGGACALLGGTDGVTFGTTIIAAQTVTSSGGPTAVANSSTINYVEISCTTPITGSGAVLIDYSGYKEAQSDMICGQSVMFDGTTTGSTQLVALSGSTHVYVCGYEFMSGGTVNVKLRAGTGTACASAVSGATNVTLNGGSAGDLTPAWQLTAQVGKVSVWPTHGFLFDAGAGNALCSNLSGATQAEVQVWFTQR